MMSAKRTKKGRSNWVFDDDEWCRSPVVFAVRWWLRRKIDPNRRLMIMMMPRTNIVMKIPMRNEVFVWRDAQSIIPNISKLNQWSMTVMCYEGMKTMMTTKGKGNSPFSFPKTMCVFHYTRRADDCQNALKRFFTKCDQELWAKCFNNQLIRNQLNMFHSRKAV